MSLLENHPDLLTVEETAEILRTAPAVVMDLTKTEEIVYVEIAGKILVLRQTSFR